jgi:hypothetical protein
MVANNQGPINQYASCVCSQTHYTECPLNARGGGVSHKRVLNKLSAAIMGSNSQAAHLSATSTMHPGHGPDAEAQIMMDRR